VHVFVTGGTGYIGRRLIPTLLARGHNVRALGMPFYAFAGLIPSSVNRRCASDW
jgi:nucleoside-diphosphate-sugar epimerase